MKKIFVFLWPLIFSNCFFGKQIIEDSYYHETIYGVAYEIEIKKDGTFAYRWQNGLNKGITVGNWKKNGNHLYLKGKTKPLKEKIIVQESFYPGLDSNYIKVTDLNNNPLSLANVIINDSLSITTDMDGKAIIGKITMMRIKINYLTFDIPDYYMNQFSNNHVVVKINTDAGYGVYFENTKVRVRNRKLIIPGNIMSGYAPIVLKQK